MPRRNDPVRLSRLNGGINRFETEATPNQCVDARNVYEDSGDLRRRPAFKAFLTGAPFWLPSGKTVVAHEVIGGATTLHYDRVATIPAAQIGGTTHHLYIGCDDPFDGFDWCNIDTVPTAPTAHNYLQPRYWDGSAWTAIPSIVDTTRERILNGSDFYYQSLCKNGRVSWHREAQMSDWATTTVGSLLKYWIRLDLSDGAISGTGNLEIAAPGPKPFTLEPVSSLYSARVRTSEEAVLIGSDRAGQTYLETGGQVGIHKACQDEVEVGYLIGDEGSGVIGQYAPPSHVMQHSTWTGASTARQYPGPQASSGIWTGVAVSPGGSMGTATNTRITKLDQRYTWLNDDGAALPARQMQWRGGILAVNRSTTGAGSNDTTAQRSTVPITSLAIENLGIYEGCRLRCVTDGSGTGTPVGEEREIVQQNSTTLIVHPHFSIAPDSQNEYDIIKPHARIRMHESDRESLEVHINGDHYLEIRDGVAYAADSDIDDALVHFKVGNHLHWYMPRGKFWTATYDIVRREIVMVNGHQPIAYDGKDFRELDAVSDEDNARVQQIVGGLDEGPDTLRTAHLAGSFLKKNPPKGQFIVNFANRLVIAGEDQIEWSYPGLDNDIWPQKFTSVVRDRFNSTISSMTVLNELLVVSTPTTIFTAPIPGKDLMINLSSVVSGSGFVSHRGVSHISRGGSSVLVGPTQDTLVLFDGYNIQNIFDDWRRIIPGGINQARLNEACGMVSLARGEYYLAIAGAGSDYNNYVLVYNFEKNRVWLWDAPWTGITSMVRDFDSVGRETLLFGTKDGHVAKLVEADTDDGDAITGWARSPNLHIAGTQTFAPTALLVTAKETGSVNSLTVKPYIDERGAAVRSSTATLDAGASLYGGSDVWGPATGSNTSAQFAKDGLVTKKFQLPNGTRCESFGFEVRGTSQWKFRLAELLVTGKGFRSK